MPFSNNHFQNLQQKHHNLDETIKTATSTFQDDTEIKTLKKQKLLLKEKIQRFQAIEQA
jgi:hypothetical protein